MKPADLARAAVRALHAELVLEPKPGLVSLRDNGSHTDMNADHLMRSLFALRHYFATITQAGLEAAPFARLEALGVAAERRMLEATGGVNTHRGGIFLLGLLCAAGGRLLARREALTPQALRTALTATWGPALRERAARARQLPARSNGQRVAREHGLRSAGDEAADGFPTLFDDVWPVLAAALARGEPPREALVQTLFATLAVLDDTNLVHRGGLAGLRFAREAAAGFLAAGGTRQAAWPARAREVHLAFVARNLSPGGSADLLAAAHWLHAVTQPGSHSATAPCSSSASMTTSASASTTATALAMTSEMTSAPASSRPARLVAPAVP